MLDLAIQFKRSLIILNSLGYHFLEDFKSEGQSNVEEFILAFYHKSLRNIEGRKKKELVKEILDIEFEKAKLRDDKIGIAKIALIELKTTYQIEELLSGNNGIFLNQKFSINPLVSIFESGWRFIHSQDGEKFEIIRNLSQPKSDFYFLFQRTGIYDYVENSNVLECSLNKYEYFLIRIFETPKTARKAILKFINIFEHEHEQELEELTNQSLEMIRILIFRRFIVLSP